ncbi:MAG: hypothetical protein H6Q76_2753 [Firmicutes bacterium]|nr:hypothetical protein [Bacillota bacterium]
MRRYGAEFWAVLIVAAFIMFFQLGSNPLLDPDEPVYAQTAREMLAAGDLLSPRIYGDYWYDKPPMYYWLVAAASQVFGMGEFAARFPSALLAVAGSVYLYLSVARLISVRAGLFSALVLTTSVEYFYLGKAAVTDMTLSFCLMVALLSFIEKKYMRFYLFAALAVVTKGPIGLFFAGGIVFLYLAATQRWRELARMSLLKGAALFTLIAAPWYALMIHYHGAAFVDTFLGFHILLFFLIWAAVVFVFFSISATKLVSYILPMYPALAVILGWYLDQAMEYGREKPRASWIVLTMLLSGGLIWGLFKALDTMPYLEAGVLGCSAVIFLMAVISAVLIWRQKLTSAVGVQAVSMMLFISVVTSLLIPALAPTFSSRELALEFRRQYDGTSTMHVQKFLQPGVAFYAEIFGPEFKTGAKLSELLARGEKGYVLVQRKMYEKLPPSDQQKLIELAAVEDKMIFRIRP